VILTIDSGDFVFLDCAYEELLQSLGPITTRARCPGPCQRQGLDGIFDVYDQYILNLPLRSAHKGQE